MRPTPKSQKNISHFILNDWHFTATAMGEYFFSIFRIFFLYFRIDTNSVISVFTLLKIIKVTSRPLLAGTLWLRNPKKWHHVAASHSNMSTNLWPHKPHGHNAMSKTCAVDKKDPLNSFCHYHDDVSDKKEIKSRLSALIYTIWQADRLGCN